MDLKDIYLEIEPFIDKYCYCWSEKKYEDCCKNWFNNPILWKDYIEFLKKSWIKNKSIPIWPYNKVKEKIINKNCLFIDCNKKAIKSHLISKNVLKNIFWWDTHFKTLEIIDSNKWTQILLNDKWIKNIKTFYWWCNYHDNTIFSKIDNSNFSNELEFIFLYCYRSLWYELKAKILQLRVNYGLLFYWLKTELDFILPSFIWVYLWYIDIKKRFNIISWMLQAKKYKKLKNFVFEIKNANSPIFVSSCINISIDLEWNELLDNTISFPPPIIFNILSSWNNIYVTFSFIGKDFLVYKSLISQLNFYYKENIELFLNIINNYIYYHCENVVVSSSFENEDVKQIHFYETNFLDINYLDNPKVKYIKIS